MLRLLLSIRHFLFDKGILRSTTFPFPVIGFGNLETGGTGKTPHTIDFIERFSSDVNLAFLSRGYGRISKGFLEINPETTVENCGDEPKLISNRFPNLTAAVCESRPAGIARLKELHPAIDAVVLDDCLQHRPLNPSFKILITAFDKPFWKNRLFPFGSLRDLKSRAKAADVLIISKCPEGISEETMKQIQKEAAAFTSATVVFTRMKPGQPYRVFGNHSTASEVIAFCGIAHPTSFFELAKNTFKIHSTQSFPDHHTFTSNEIQTLIAKSTSAHCFDWVTTEKDAVRLHTFRHTLEAAKITLWAIPISVDFCTSAQQENYERIIRKHLKSFTRNG